jgi:hypothetical protein
MPYVRSGEIWSAAGVQNGGHELGTVMVRDCPFDVLLCNTIYSRTIDVYHDGTVKLKC